MGSTELSKDAGVSLTNVSQCLIKGSILWALLVGWSVCTSYTIDRSRNWLGRLLKTWLSSYNVLASVQLSRNTWTSLCSSLQEHSREQNKLPLPAAPVRAARRSPLPAFSPLLQRGLRGVWLVCFLQKQPQAPERTGFSSGFREQWRTLAGSVGGIWVLTTLLRV